MSKECKVNGYRYEPEYKGTYLVVHSTGTGVMEDPFVEKGIIDSFDYCESAHVIANTFKHKTNTKEEIESTWYNNHYTVAVNTATEEGMRLYEQWGKEFDATWESLQSDEHYTKMELSDGQTVMVPKEEWGQPTLGEQSENALQTYKFDILDFSSSTTPTPPDPIIGIASEVLEEMERQREKWGEQNHPVLDPEILEDPDKDAICRDRYGVTSEYDAKLRVTNLAVDDSLSYMDILLEEVSEAVSAADIESLRKELIQVAAVTLSMIASLDRNGR